MNTIKFTGIIRNGQVNLDEARDRVVREAHSAGIPETVTADFLAKVVSKAKAVLRPIEEAKGKAIVTATLEDGQLQLVECQLIYRNRYGDRKDCSFNHL